jgi:hypothetical protein
MNSENKVRYINAFIVSAALAVVFIAAVTIFAELYAPLKDWLKNTFTHHWVGKGVLSFAGFYVLGFLFSFTVGSKEESTVSLLYVLTLLTVLAALSIIGFYLYETFVAVH